MPAAPQLTVQKKLEEMRELIADIETAMMTTRRQDGRLVSRPMATQRPEAIADVWFVTNIETHKVEELEMHPEVNLAYFNPKSSEWVSVSGHARITQDRAKIHQLYAPDWRAWFGDEGGKRDGGPDDPRLALILVDAESVHYMKAKHTRPVALFEVAKGVVTGDPPDVGREESLTPSELRAVDGNR